LRKNYNGTIEKYGLLSFVQELLVEVVSGYWQNACKFKVAYKYIRIQNSIENAI
jgi:hypothetical protein